MPIQQPAESQQHTQTKSAFHENVKTANAVLHEPNEVLRYDHIDGTMFTESSSVANVNGNQQEPMGINGNPYQNFNLMKGHYSEIFNVNYPGEFTPPNQLTSRQFGSLTEVENASEIDLTKPFIGTAASKEEAKMMTSKGTMEEKRQKPRPAKTQGAVSSPRRR